MAALMGWNFTIPDTSSMLRYEPFGSGGWESTTPGIHFASTQNASVSLDFYGDGLRLIGLHNASYTVIVDDETLMDAAMPEGNAAVDGDLFNTTNLSLGPHTAILSLSSGDPTLVVGIKQAVTYNSENEDIVDVSSTKLDCLDPLLELNDKDWIRIKDSRIASNDQREYVQSDTEGASYSFSFSGTRAFSIVSSLGDTHSATEISINDETVKYENSRENLVPRTVQFFRDGLDENVSYTVRVKTLEPGRITFTKAEFFGSKASILGANSTTSSSATSTSTTSIFESSTSATSTSETSIPATSTITTSTSATSTYETSMSTKSTFEPSMSATNTSTTSTFETSTSVTSTFETSMSANSTSATSTSATITFETSTSATVTTTTFETSVLPSDVFITSFSLTDDSSTTSNAAIGPSSTNLFQENMLTTNTVTAAATSADREVQTNTLSNHSDTVHTMTYTISVPVSNRRVSTTLEPVSPTEQGSLTVSKSSAVASPTFTSDNTPPGLSNVGAKELGSEDIAASVIGGLVGGLVLLAIGLFLIRRCRMKRRGKRTLYNDFGPSDTNHFPKELPRRHIPVSPSSPDLQQILFGPLSRLTSFSRRKPLEVLPAIVHSSAQPSMPVVVQPGLVADRISRYASSASSSHSSSFSSGGRDSVWEQGSNQTYSSRDSHVDLTLLQPSSRPPSSSGSLGSNSYMQVPSDNQLELMFAMDAVLQSLQMDRPVSPGPSLSSHSSYSCSSYPHSDPVHDDFFEHLTHPPSVM